MNPTFVAAAWCIAQVTCLLGIAILLSYCFARRFPTLTSTAISTVVLLVAVTTIFSAMPIPTWHIIKTNNTTSKLEHASATQTISDHKQAEPSNQLPRFDLALAIKHLVNKTKVQHIVESQVSVAHWVIPFILLSTTIGIIRLSCSCIAIRRLGNSSHPIDDPNVKKLLNELSKKLGCQRKPKLCESDRIHSPATAGYFRQTILLPKQHWRTWQTDELRAVLAHELAHVVRRDFLWRGLAAAIKAIHFYHPLAHWLVQRQTYTQELAADRLAAQSTSGRLDYSQKLSQLAIRHDDWLRLRAEPALLPSLSHQLIRRIKMLRAKECNENTKLQKSLRLATSATIALFSLTLLAIRGLAPEAHAQPANNATSQQDNAAAQPIWFARQPSTPLVDPENEQGLFVVKVAKLFEQKSLQPYVELINQTASQTWQDFFKSPSAPELEIQSLEYITGMGVVKIKRLEEDHPAKHKNLLTYGSPYFIIRFKNEVSSWREWVRAYVPKAKEVTLANRACFEFPIIPAISHQPMHLGAFDNRTLCFANSAQALEDLLSTTLEHTDKSHFKNWQQVDKGLATILSSKDQIEPSLFEADKPDTQAMDQIFDNIQQFGFSIDCDDATSQVGVKLHLICSNQQAAQRVNAGVEKFSVAIIEEAEQRLHELENSPEDSAKTTTEESKYATKEDCAEAIALITNSKVETIGHEDKTATVVVTLDLSTSLPEMFQDMFGPNEENVASKPSAAATK